MTPTIPTGPKDGVCPMTTRQLVDVLLNVCEQVNERSFYVYQALFARRIIESLLLRDGATITALFCRQSGKSEIVACISIGLAVILPALARLFPKDERLARFAGGFWVGIFAPTNKHSFIVYSRMRKRVESQGFQIVLSDPDLQLALTHSRGDSFALTNGSLVMADTASDNVLNEGFTFHLIITDESQKLTGTKVNKELRPMLAATNGTMVSIGTAFMSRSGFYRDIQTNVARERKTGKRNHYQFDYKQVIRDRRRQFEKDGKLAHLDYEKWVYEELTRLGNNEDDETFKMNFRLLWQDSFSNALDMTKFAALGNTSIEANDLMSVARLPGGRLIAGIDVAKDGDSTWVTVGHQDYTNPAVDVGASSLFPRTDGKQPSTNEDPAVYYHVTVLGWLKLNGNFEGDYGQYAQIVQFLSMWPGLEVVAIDTTAMGDPVHERLNNLMPYLTWVAYPFNVSTKHVLYRWYLQEIGAGRFHYAAGPKTQESPLYKDFISQHTTLVRSYYGNYLRVAAGEDGDHDDAADSAALMCMASKQESGVPTVNVSEGTSNARNVPHVDVQRNHVSILQSVMPRDRRSVYAGRRLS